MSYAHDVITLRYGKINDGVIRFSRIPQAQPPAKGAGATARRSRVTMSNCRLT
jgi:hypothetical protein